MSRESEHLRIAESEHDAAHPRFIKPPTDAETEAYERENHYYCHTCKLYLAPTVTALQLHFVHEIKKHQPIGSCFYCGGAVYDYLFCNQTQIYHSCLDACEKGDRRLTNRRP